MERFSSSVTIVENEKHDSLVPQVWENTVRQLAMDDCSDAGLSLSVSFASDHLSHYLLDGEDMAGHSAEQKWKLHLALMRTVVASHCLKGSVTTIGPDFDGLAIWDLPRSNTDGWWTMFRSGMLKLYFQLPQEGRRRYYKEMLPLLTRTKQEVMGDRDDDCYYLVYIGTKPHARGKGYAGKLLRHMMRKADAEKRAMYLESSSKANNAYYEKFGFKVVKDISLTRGPEPIKLDIMVREPQLLKVG